MAASLLSLAAAATAELVVSAAFHRDGAGRQWVLSFSQEGTGYLRRFDDAGVLVAELLLPGATDEARSAIASDSSGHVWVAGGVSDAGRTGLGVWHVSTDGTTLLSSATVFGNFNVYAGGVAVDGSDRIWVSVASQTADAESFEFALLRFAHDGSLDAGFPKTQQRPGGVLDGGLSVAVDSVGDVWSAGVSSNPVTGAYDLALWKFDPDGNLKAGFPAYRGSAYATLDELGSGIVVAASDKVWVAASQVFPGCVDNHAALFRFDTDARLELQRFWHNQDEISSSGQVLALTPAGDPWMVGFSSVTGGFDQGVIWSYDRVGRLAPGYPKTMPGLDFTGLAVDNGGAPWVVNVATPVPFLSGTTVPGAEGLPSCAQLLGGTISGEITFASSFPVGSTITVVASTDGFNESLFAFTHVSTGGFSFAYTATVDTPGDFQVGAFLGDNPDLVDVSTPLGFYDHFRWVALAPGESASGIDFSIALDTAPPTSAVTFPLSGSTVATLGFIEGTAADNTAAQNRVIMAVEDLTAQRWWQPWSQPPWVVSGEPLFSDADNEQTGTPAAFDWVVVSSGDVGPFGRLAEYLANGHQYRISVKAVDFVGHEQDPASTMTFVWAGPTGDLAPPSPGFVQGQGLGVSSISWTWFLVNDATSYQLARYSEGPVFASVSAPPYVDDGHGIAEHVTLCVAAVNPFTAGPFNCNQSATDAAAPGAPVAVSVGTGNIAWSWDPGPNPSTAFYELTLSTDGFVSHVSTPLPIGSYHPGTSADVHGLEPGTEYSARVRAYSINLRPSDYTASGTTTTLNAGPTPPLLTATFDRENGRVSLSWTPQGETPAASYVVFRGTDPFSLPVLSTGVTATSLLDVPPVSATYYYTVAGVTSEGFEGYPSAPQAVLFDATPPTLAVDVEQGATLSRPRYVVATAFDDLRLAEVSFQVDGATRATTTAAHQFLWDIRDETDGLHQLAVVARDGVGNETTLVRDVTVAYSTPPAPSVSVPPDDFSTVETTFTAFGSAPLFTAVSIRLDGVEVATTTVNHIGLWQTVVPFPGRGDFLLTVRAFETRGQSEDSAPARVASFAQPPGPVENLTGFVDREVFQVTLNWTAPSGPTPATSYRVERATSPTGQFFVSGSTSAAPFRDQFPLGSGDYTYRVHALHGTGLISAPASVSVLFDLTPPVGPVDLRVSRPSQEQLEISWDPAVDDFSGIARYLLERSEDGSFGPGTSTTVVTGTSVVVPVTLSTVAFRVYSEDNAGNRSAPSNPRVFDPFPPEITDVDVADGATVSRPRFLTPTVTDNVGISRVVYSLDGVVFATATSHPFAALWTLVGVPDGAHQLTVNVFDGFSNQANLTRSVLVNYVPPSPPVIQSPGNGFTVNAATVSVSGTAPVGTGVQILVNNVDAASTTTNAFGSWSTIVPIGEEGEVRLTAIAFETRGFSAPSAAVDGTFTTRAPEPPTRPQVTLLSGGRARLVWTAGPGKVPSSYHVYRSTDDLDLEAGAPAPDPTLRVGFYLQTPEFLDFTDHDDLYFYAVTALDGAGNESLLSESVYAFVDSNSPSGAVSLSSTAPSVLGVGQYPVTLTVTEVLIETPVLVLTPAGGDAVPLSLAPASPTVWRGTLTVTAEMPPGQAEFTFQGRDLALNPGTDLTAGRFLMLDTRGPAGTLSLSAPSPLRAGAWGVTLALDESAVSTPTLSWTPLSAAPIPVMLASSAPHDGRSWTGVVEVESATPQGEARFSYLAQDALGNVSNLLGGTTVFLVDTVAPGMPLVPHANPAAGGRVNLSWSGPGGERPVLYQLYRDSAPLAQVTPAADLTGAYADTAADGEHTYEMSSLDAAGNEGAKAMVVGVADSLAPAAPQNLTVQLNAFGQIELNWAAGDAEAVSFRLYRATSPIVSLGGLASRAAVSPFVDSASIDATYHYVVTARDGAGNESAASDQQSVLYDRAAPVIVISGIIEGAVTAANVVLSYEIVDGNLDPASVSALLDGAPFVAGSTLTAEGPHSFSVTATDFEGRSSTETRAFAIDRTAPSVAITGISDGANLVGTTSATVAVADLHLTSSSILLVDLTRGTTTPYVSGETISLDGDFRIDAAAFDAAGNTGVASVSFHLDAAPSRPGALAVKVGDGAALTWVRPEADVVGYRVYRNGVRISATLHASTNFHDAAGAGTRVYEVSAIDGRGTEGARARATVPSDSLTLPALTLTRGYVDAIRPFVGNPSTTPFTAGPASFALVSGGVTYASGVSVAGTVPGSTGASLDGALAAPDGAPASAGLTVTVPLSTDAGAAVLLEKTFTVSVRDPAIPQVEVLPGALTPGAYAPVRLRFYNRGTAPLDVITGEIVNSTLSATGRVTVRLKNAQDFLLSSAGLRKSAPFSTFLDGRQVFFVTVPPGESVLTDPVQLPVPASAQGSLTVEATVSSAAYALGFPTTRIFAARNHTASAERPVGAALPYGAFAAPDRSFYDQGSSVTITGTAFTPSGSTVAYVPVLIHIVGEGYDRAVDAVSDFDGSFRTVFHPLPNEAGVYSITALHPLSAYGGVQSTFAIAGFGFNFRDFTLNIAQNSTLNFDLELRNSGGVPLSGLSLSSASFTGSGVSLQATGLPESLPAGEKAVLRVTASAAPTASSSTASLTVTESHGFSRSIPIIASVSPAIVLPKATPQQFQLGIVSGETRSQLITIENKGFETWRDVEISTPALTWAHIIGSQRLGDLAPGANASFTLFFEPPAGLPSGLYAPSPLLNILSDNAPALPIHGVIGLTTDRKGTVLVSAVNADEPRNAQGQGVGVPGAQATLVSLDVDNLTLKQTADANGVARFDQTPAGRYSWRVEATGFQTRSGTAVVEPGLDNLIQVLLPTSMITYKWTVSPTTIQDKYEISLKLTFHTDVPAPVLVIDPPLINLNMEGGQTAYAQYTVTNKGLVKATDFRLAFANDPAMHIDTPFDVIPEILPGQTIIVPVRVRLDHASCHNSQVTHEYGYFCRNGEAISFIKATNVTITAGSCGTNSSGAGYPAPLSGGGGGFYMVGDGPFVSNVEASFSPQCAKALEDDVNLPTRGRDAGCRGGTNPLSRSVNTAGSPVSAGDDDLSPFYTPSHNSDGSYGGEALDTSSPDGVGWTSNLNQSVTDSDGMPIYTDANGSEHRFRPAGNVDQIINGPGAGYAQPVNGYTKLSFTKGRSLGRDSAGNERFSPSYYDISNPDGSKMKFEAFPGGKALPIAFTDVRGNRFNVDRDSTTGRMISVAGPNARALNFTYNAGGRIASVTDGIRTTSYEYDAQGRRTHETSPGIGTTQYEYDSNHRVTQVAYPNGSHKFFTYDTAGKLTSESGDNNIDKITYLPAAATTQIVVMDANNHSTTVDFVTKSGLRKPIRITDPAGGVTRLFYNDNLELVRVVDPINRITTMKYADAKPPEDPSRATIGNGLPQSITDPSGRSIQIGYLMGSSGNLSNGPLISASEVGGSEVQQLRFPTEITDRNGNRYSFEFNGLNLSLIRDPLGNDVRLSYDGNGQVTSIQSGLGHINSLTYDSEGAVASITDSLGRTSNIYRDSEGRPIQTRDPANKQRLFEYDAMGNLTKAIIDTRLNNVLFSGYETIRQPSTTRDSPPPCHQPV